MEDAGEALRRAINDLGDLTARVERACRHPVGPTHPLVVRADRALAEAAEAVSRVLLAESPDLPLEQAGAALSAARRAVEAVEALLGRTGP